MASSIPKYIVVCKPAGPGAPLRGERYFLGVKAEVGTTYRLLDEVGPWVSWAEAEAERKRIVNQARAHYGRMALRRGQ